MTQEMTRNEFLSSFRQLQNSFESSLQEAQQLDSQFETIYRNFTKDVTSHIQNAEKSLAKTDENPLRQKVQAFFHALQNIDEEWRTKLNSKEKGIHFRKDFEDSLLVFVYGKVKSGKSSLGNYMAWGQSDNSSQIQQQIPKAEHPEYFSHARTDVASGDAEKEAEKTKQFRVGAIEATSSIQGFKLPGLTWVDSPGLHSFNGENGDLSKDYVQHADLIVYTMKSDAPGRATDLAEICDLCNQQKKVVLLITGSDDTEENIVDGEIVTEIVMKSPERQKEQQQFVLKELAEIGLSSQHNNLQILSVSTKYAELHADNASNLKNSGMSDLFVRLNQISQEEGVQLKRQTPLKNFNYFLNSCLKDLSPYQALLSEFSHTIRSLSLSLDSRSAQAIQKAQNSIKATIEQDFSTLASYRDDVEQMNAALATKKFEWNNQLNTLLQDAIHEVFSSITEELDGALVATVQTSSFDIPEFNLEQVEDSYTVMHKGNRTKRGGLGGLIGGVSGFLVGGFAGAAIGATLGSGLGSALGSSSSIETKTITLTVGDNLQDLCNSTTALYGNELQKVLDEQAKALKTGVVDKARIFMSAIEASVKDTNAKLEQLHMKSQHALELK